MNNCSCELVNSGQDGGGGMGNGSGVGDEVFLLTAADYVGYVAMICATMIYVPQIIKIRKTKSVESISYGLLIIELITDVLWNIYAHMKVLYPVMFSSILLFISSLIVLRMKFVYSSVSERGVG